VKTIECECTALPSRTSQAGDSRPRVETEIEAHRAHVKKLKSGGRPAPLCRNSISGAPRPRVQTQLRRPAPLCWHPAPPLEIQRHAPRDPCRKSYAGVPRPRVEILVWAPRAPSRYKLKILTPRAPVYKKKRGRTALVGILNTVRPCRNSTAGAARPCACKQRPRWCGGVVVWWSGGAVVGWCGGVAVWWCGCAVEWCGGGVAVWWCGAWNVLPLFR
jgi:hypothetical protein